MLKYFITFEAFLIQVIIYLLLWLWNDYLATILSLVFGGIALFLWLISLLVEWVEKSKISRSYFRMMFLCFLAPVLGAVIGLLLKNGMDWMN